MLRKQIKKGAQGQIWAISPGKGRMTLGVNNTEAEARTEESPSKESTQP